jgi:hypothetical protein
VQGQLEHILQGDGAEVAEPGLLTGSLPQPGDVEGPTGEAETLQDVAARVDGP